MENLENFIEVLPFDAASKTETFAPFEAVRQSWAAGDTLSREESNWICGNFSNSLEGASRSEMPSRIAIRALLFVKPAGEIQGRPFYTFIHA